MISDAYREQNALLHKRSCMYGACGFQNADEVHRLMAAYSAADVLDYGCGKASLGEKMGKYVRNYDPALPKYSSPPEPADLVVCADVMEHIEPEYIDSVLAHIAALTKKCAYFVISCCESKKKLPDGRNAHISIHAVEWWRAKLTEYFTVISEKIMGRNAVEFVCEPKC